MQVVSFVCFSGYYRPVVTLRYVTRKDGTMAQMSVTRLRRLRVQCGMTQQELARQAGLSRAVVNRLENNKTSPNVATVIKLAAALGVTPGMVMEAVSEGFTEGPEQRCAS